MQPSRPNQLPCDAMLFVRRTLNSFRLSLFASVAPDEPAASRSRMDSALICEAGKKPTFPAFVMPDQHHES